MNIENNPNKSASVLDEIAEQDLANVNGGTGTWIPIATVTVCSQVVGNKGYVCTWTYECQKNCT